MKEKELREHIRAKVLQFLTEKKVLQETKEEGHGKPTSGLTKAKEGSVHTEKTKSKNPPAKKVTDGGPENKTLTTAEPTKVDNEVKVMKKSDGEEPIERGKDGKQSADGFKTNCYGADLEVKGVSHADINHTYLMGQIKKSLEGRGTYVKKVTIEMGEPEKLEESKEIKTLRKKIREIVIKELNKKKNLNETGEMGQHDIQPGGDDYEWAKAIEDDIKTMEKLTGGKVKFQKMNPFDKYQGPYASVIINGKFDSIWSVPSPGSEKILYIERLEWTGTYEELASAINGDAEYIDIVKQSTESYR